MNKIKNIFYFGEKVDGYDIRVLNEREARAGAGILFLFAMISFLNSWLLGNFYWTKVFIVAFLIDFIIRVLVNPKYAPSLILGRLFITNQKPEYVGGCSKKVRLDYWINLINNNVFCPCSEWGYRTN